MYHIIFPGHIPFIVDEDILMKMSYFRDMIMDYGSLEREFTVPHRDREGFRFLLIYLIRKECEYDPQALQEEMDFYGANKYDTHCTIHACFSLKTRECDFCVNHKCEFGACPNLRDNGRFHCINHICKIEGCKHPKVIDRDYCQNHKCSSAFFCKNKRPNNQDFCQECACIVKGCFQPKAGRGTLFCVYHNVYNCVIL